MKRRKEQRCDTGKEEVVREVKRGREGGRGSMNQGLNPLGNRNLKKYVFIRASRTASLSLFGSVFSHISSSQSG